MRTLIIFLWAMAVCCVSIFVGFHSWSFVINKLYKPPAIIPDTAQTITECVKLKARHIYGEAVEYIETKSQADTIYFYPDKNKTGYAEVLVVADSVAGATNATAIYETSRGGLVWSVQQRYIGGVVPINGSAPCTLSVTDYMYNERFRVKVVSPPTTQKTRVSFKYKFD